MARRFSCGGRSGRNRRARTRGGTDSPPSCAKDEINFILVRFELVCLHFGIAFGTTPPTARYAASDSALCVTWPLEGWRRIPGTRLKSPTVGIPRNDKKRKLLPEC